MKFQKGILSDVEKSQIKAAIADQPAAPPRPPVVLGDIEKNRLFETQEELVESSQGYLKVLAIVVALIAVAGFVIFYATLPGVGDQVKASADMEDAIRDHFLTVQKRTATDVIAYKCDGFYWARVGVETRNDIPNPIYKIDKYSARATPGGEKLWNVTAQPITSPDLDIPCK